MKNTTDKKRFVRSFCVLSVAAIILCSSLVTVAAAIANAAIYDTGAAQSTDRAEESTASGSKKVVLDVNGNRKTVFFSGSTVAELLRATHTEPGDNQIVIPDPSGAVTPYMVVTVRDAKTVTLTADGKTAKVKLACGRLTESLRLAGIPLSSDDLLNVPRDSRVEEVDRLTIRRVTYRQTTAVETVAYRQKTETSDKLAAGKTTKQTAGKNGEKTIVKRVKYIDGVQASETVVSETITRQPVDEVTLVGVKGAKGVFTDENGATVAYKEVFTGSGTAYTAEAGAATATGVAAYRGGVAVNPELIPYGSRLYVVAADGSVVYGYCTAVDTGGALMDGSAIVDCFYDTYDECINFGRRDVKVYVIA